MNHVGQTIKQKKEQIVPKKTCSSILVTGASGYIGGRLLEELLARKLPVAAMIRRPDQFKERFSSVKDVRYGDAGDLDSLITAFEGVETLFYLIHSLSKPEGFSDHEANCARNVVEAAKKVGVKKIIYLGGLFDPTQRLSRHLKSRKNVGNILRASGIPTVTFRASIILGSGSLSFELIRSLTEKLPFMITPKWVRVKAQPIAIADVLSYLLAAIKLDLKKNEVFEIGGSDQVSYVDIMKEYAKQRDLKRFIVPVPVLSPYLSSLWLSLFTPLYASIGKKLICSIYNVSVVNDPKRAQERFNIKPMSMRDAIKRAIIKEDAQFRKTHWASAYSSSNYQNKWLSSQAGNKLVYTKHICIDQSIQNCFKPIQSIGGKNGWYFGQGIWVVRGLFDSLMGGPGLTRGRLHPELLKEGDFVDWWRVEQIKAPHILRLVAEMKVPGRAWLEFELKAVGDTQTHLFLSAIFDPSGFFGRLYWQVLYPVHFYMFSGLLKALKAKIETP